MSDPSQCPPLRLVALAASLVAALAVAGCGSSHPPDTSSTETGNPPVIDPSLIALVVTAGEVHLVGEPGAVTPGGVEIVVRTLGSDELVRVTAEPDGSFDVQVDGEPEDAFEVRAVDGETTSAAVYVLRGGAVVADENGENLSCEERTNLAALQIEQIADAADTSCETSADCTAHGLAMTCHGTCESVVVSRQGHAEIEVVFDALERGLCDGFQDDGCRVTQPPCPPGPLAQFLACVDGQCELGGSTGGECGPCLSEDVSWGMTGSFGFPEPEVDSSRYTVSGCTDFTLRTFGGKSCTSQLPGCDGDAVTRQDLQARLADPDVQAAFAAGEYLYRVPGPDEAYFDVRVGDQVLNFGPPCIDGQPCNQPAPSVAALRELLDAIADQQRCTPDLCFLPYDEGTGTPLSEGFAYDPPSKTCVARSFMGGGGNENRFDSLELCQASCPALLGDPGCPPNRVYLEDACVSPSPVAGCAATAPACALVCSDTSQCEGDSLGFYCTTRDACEAFSPL